MARTKRGNIQFLGRYNYYFPSFAEFFILVFWFLIGILIGNLVTLLFTAVAGNDISVEYSMLVSYPLMFLPAMIYASFKSRSNMMSKRGIKLDNNNFAPKGGFLCAVLVMAGTLAVNFCCDFFTNLLPEMPTRLKVLLESMVNGNLWVNFICVSLYAPVFEEWLCRGIVMRGLLGNGTRPVWAIILSALFFAIIHANPWQAIPAFMMGCLFGYVYYRTGSLRLTMLMHFTNNTLSLIVSNSTELEAFDSWKEILPSNLYWIIICASAIITVLVVKAFKDIPLKFGDSSFETLPSLFEER